MSDPIIVEQVVAAGFFGLNTQESSVSLPNSYALLLDNAVIDSQGRVGARRGIQTLSTTLYDDVVGCLHEAVSTNGSKAVLSVSKRKFYLGMPSNVLQFTHPDVTTGNNWTAVNLNNHAFFFQRGVEPVYYDFGTGVTNTILNHPHYIAPAPKANCALGAFGRVWAADTDTNKTVLYYSDTLLGYKWGGGSSGSIDLTTVFPNGGDEIVALASFNNRLVIFARKSIILYTGADDPTTMVVEDAIDTLGCISRDTVQDTGVDIIFLSDSGLKSLGRVVEERSNPINDLSINVKDVFMSEVTRETLSNIRSVYYEKDSFYLISLPSFQRVWCFDTRQKLENGGFRVTTWSQFTAHSLLATSSRLLLVGDNDKQVSTYDKYNMKNSSYQFSYFSNHLNSGDSSITKILKKLSVLIVGGARRLVLGYNTNYAGVLNRKAVSIRSGATVAEYGVSEYNVAEYAVTTTQSVETNIGGSGSVYQIGVEAEILNSSFSLQQLLIKYKKGRIF